jgi:hypothetical protein
MAEQKAEQRSTQDLPQPLRAAASVLSRVPGAGMVSGAAEGVLDKVGAVSPRGRRLAVYTGAGVLGVAGVVEWPVAVTGAAVAWLTQSRQKEPEKRAVEAAGDTARSGGSESAGSPAAGTPASKASGRPPTPREVASTAASAGGQPAEPAAGQFAEPAAEGTSSLATPSDKLPTHHTGPPATSAESGEPGAPTTRPDRTNG